MTVPYHLIGTNNKTSRILEQEMHEKNGIGIGSIVYAERLLDFSSTIRPFINEVNGINMAIDATFSGVPSFVYESGAASDAASGTASSTSAGELVDAAQGGGNDFDTTIAVGMVVKNTTDTTYARVVSITNSTTIVLDTDIFISGEGYTIGAEWPASVVTGSGWNLVGDISLTNGLNNDTIILENPHTSDLSDYKSLSGTITLTTWSDLNNSLDISFSVGGVPVGSAVDLNDFIDTSLLGVAQNFVLPLSSLGLTTQIVDELNIIVLRSGGPRPDFDIDDIQLEAAGAGGSVVYKVQAKRNEKFHIYGIRWSFADVLDLSITNGTVAGLSYNKIMALTALTNGIVFQRKQEGEIQFAITLKQFSDFLGSGGDITNVMSDVANSYVTIQVTFSEPIVLDGNLAADLNFLSITINDNLSDLLLFNVFARGAVEV